MIHVCVAAFATVGSVPGAQFDPVIPPDALSSKNRTQTPVEAPATGLPLASFSSTSTRCVSCSLETDPPSRGPTAAAAAPIGTARTSAAAIAKATLR